MQDDRMNQIQSSINHLNNVKRALRDREANLDARSQYLNNPGTFPASTVKNLRNTLLGNLPAHMMPGNVGGINQVTWPFYFQAVLDFGQDPTIEQTNIVKSFFQVDQEAAFLIMSIERSHSTDAAGASATVNAPIQIDLIDRQSSRRFSSLPSPLQCFGFNSCPSIFPTPFYMQPNAFLDIQASGIPAVGQNYTGSGAFTLSFFGYRIRTEDAGKVLSTIFQQL